MSADALLWAARIVTGGSFAIVGIRNIGKMMIGGLLVLAAAAGR